MVIDHVPKVFSFLVQLDVALSYMVANSVMYLEVSHDFLRFV